jgi:hypothetical protein
VEAAVVEFRLRYPRYVDKRTDRSGRRARGYYCGTERVHVRYRLIQCKSVGMIIAGRGVGIGAGIAPHQAVSGADRQGVGRESANAVVVGGAGRGPGGDRDRQAA